MKEKRHGPVSRNFSLDFATFFSTLRHFILLYEYNCHGIRKYRQWSQKEISVWSSSMVTEFRIHEVKKTRFSIGKLSLHFATFFPLYNILFHFTSKLNLCRKSPKFLVFLLCLVIIRKDNIASVIESCFY